MLNRRVTLLVRLLCVSLVSAHLLLAAGKTVSAQEPKSNLRAGAAVSNITPPLGLPIVGGFLPFPSTNVHDELHARCLVLDNGTTKLAIVVCDLLGIDRLVSDEARALIQSDLGIPADNVLISATHTHSASSALGSRQIVSHTMDDYQRFVARRIVDGVKRAHNLLRPAEIASGSIDVPEHVFNRRWYLKPGKMPPNPFGGIDKVKMNPGAGSADLVEPAGPTDPAVAILALREPGGKPIAVFTTYSLHYVGGVGNGDISADYYGMYCERLARLVAEGQTPAFVALMANGTSGDINNINFRTPRPRQKPYEQMQYVADDLARKVHATLGGLAYRDRVILGARFREPTIGTRRPSAEQLAWAKKTLSERVRIPGKADLPSHYAESTLRMAQAPAEVKIPLQALRIGDVAIGTMPVEVFSEIGLEFKKRNAGRPAWLVELAHGSYGYLPTPRQHELGGYETWLGTNRLETQASERMLATLMEMTGELGR